MKTTNLFATAIISSAILWQALGVVRAQAVEGIRMVASYGAKGDGRTLNTKAINQAIRECYADGGGTVNFPAGTYRSGPIELLNNVTLNLEAGAVLLGGIFRLLRRLAGNALPPPMSLPTGLKFLKSALLQIGRAYGAQTPPSQRRLAQSRMHSSLAKTVREDFGRAPPVFWDLEKGLQNFVGRMK